MSLHPTLQPYADAWTHSIDAISELVQPLVEGVEPAHTVPRMVGP